MTSVFKATFVPKNIAVCPSGSYINANNNDVCEACPINTYGSGTDAGNCNNCPSGTNTQGQTGQNSQSACGKFRKLSEYSKFLR